MKNSAQRGMVESKGTLEHFGMRLHMKPKALNLFLSVDTCRSTPITRSDAAKLPEPRAYCDLGSDEV